MQRDESTPAIDVKNIEFRRNRRVILSDVNLRIEPGERWVIFGPNGIGKSTLVSMMAARLFPSKGTIDILGNRLGRVDVFSLRPLIGLASEELAKLFPPREDPLDAVVTAGTGVTGRWRDTYTQEQTDKARGLLERFGVGYLEGKQMWQLSAGETSRVLIARALMNDPKLLILDEPTTGLDLGAREQVISTLNEIGMEDSSRAAVLVTHRLEEIPQGFGNIALLGRTDSNPDRAGRNPAPGTVVFRGPIEDGLTDEWLRALFGMDLHVSHIAGRWNAFVN
ncbi:MAG: ATP-binding cassette domain-containing protein [Bifidobacteriaceae bacterium]|jgi:iron complex transport system ATP-binding protein|nr:ATP-binding cassette domain-containing protein [Bifidobacteriaceae bacterium]MCI1979289.1 ATP-binding cassette domain-containing protein [Bifidobacteriaceae bacterium]